MFNNIFEIDEKISEKINVAEWKRNESYTSFAVIKYDTNREYADKFFVTSSSPTSLEAFRAEIETEYPNKGYTVIQGDRELMDAIALSVNKKPDAIKIPDVNNLKRRLSTGTAAIIMPFEGNDYLIAVGNNDDIEKIYTEHFSRTQCFVIKK